MMMDLDFFLGYKFASMQESINGPVPLNMVGLNK